MQTLADLSTQDQLVLQDAMQQKDQFEETFSHLLKATQDTTNSVIGNHEEVTVGAGRPRRPAPLSRAAAADPAATARPRTA